MTLLRWKSSKSEVTQVYEALKTNFAETEVVGRNLTFSLTNLEDALNWQLTYFFPPEADIELFAGALK